MNTSGGISSGEKLCTIDIKIAKPTDGRKLRKLRDAKGNTIARVPVFMVSA